MQEPSEQQPEVVVVGAGAAGLVAAFRAAERGRRTLLVEKNRKPGAKILMSGGTRCNLTHDTDPAGILREFGPQARFLRPAVNAFGPRDVIAMFEAEGVPTTVEAATGKVFPASDKALDVLGALVRRLRRSGCALALEEPLVGLERIDAGFRLATPRRILTPQRVVLTTGGRSYPGCGTVGDGYAWAESLGHSIVAPRPALVPLRTDAAWVAALRGITIADAVVRIGPAELASSPGGLPRSAILAERRGSVLFAHFGLTGPAVLDVSRAVSGHPDPATLAAVCDFLPAMRPEELDAILVGQAAAAGRRLVATIVAELVPQRLAETLLEQAGVPPDRRAAELAKSERQRLAAALKRCVVLITGTLGFRKAEVTAGGVALDEVDPRTIESRLAPGLFFAGELLDLDGPIGGYNFQAAFSTGWLAGGSV